MSACRSWAALDAELPLEPPQAESTTASAASTAPISSFRIESSLLVPARAGTAAGGDLHIATGVRLGLNWKMLDGCSFVYPGRLLISGVLAHQWRLSRGLCRSRAPVPETRVCRSAFGDIRRNPRPT